MRRFNKSSDEFRYEKQKLYILVSAAEKSISSHEILYRALNKPCNSSYVRNINRCQRKIIFPFICYEPYGHPQVKLCGYWQADVEQEWTLFLILSWWRSWQGISPAQTGHVSIGGGNQRSALGSTLSGTVATSMAAKASQSVEQTPEILQAPPLYALPDNTRWYHHQKNQKLQKIKE